MTTTKHSARRGEIIAALRRVVRDRGLHATNVRSVAEEAGISPASVLYYFNSMDELVEQSVGGVLAEFYHHRVDLIENIPDPRDRINALIDAGVPDTVSEDLRLVYAVLSALPSHPRHVASLQSVLEKQVMLYFTTIEIGVALGYFTPIPSSMSVARNMVAIEDSYDIYPLIDMPISREELRRNLRAYAEVSLGCDLSSRS
ncbi:MAG: hypothetical protein RIS25_1075 [Actinomycetota bacterium]